MVLYAAHHPGRVVRLVLITPSVHAVDLEITAEDPFATARRRADVVTAQALNPSVELRDR